MPALRIFFGVCGLLLVLSAAQAQQFPNLNPFSNGGRIFPFPSVMPPASSPSVSEEDENPQIAQIQESLVWLGLYAGPIDGDLGPKTTAAIKQFQKSLDAPPTGELLTSQFETLKSRALVQSQAISFSTIIDNRAGLEVGIPTRLVPRRSYSRLGTNFNNDDNSIVIASRAFRGAGELSQTFSNFKIALGEAKFDYSALRADWFVLAGTLEANRFYLRFQRNDSFLSGFIAVYSNSVDFAVPLTMMSLTLRVAQPGYRFSTQNTEQDAINELAVLIRSKSSQEKAPSATTNYKPQIDLNSFANHWKYNDSILSLHSSGNDRIFTVVTPGAAAQRQGIKTSDRIFVGRRAGLTYSGVAFAFDPGCESIPFPVSGTVGLDEESIELSGLRPTRQQNCKINGRNEDRIHFSYIKNEQKSTQTSLLKEDTRVEAQPLTVESTNPDQSKAVLESVQELVGKSNAQGVRFFRYMVSKANLPAFNDDMPILRVVFPEKVFFDTDKAVLRPENLGIIEILANTVKDRSQASAISLFVAGHTDARGSDQHNLDLSYRRADAVAQALVSKGIGRAGIWRVGFGKSVPLLPNSNSKNWAYNRRVEFLIASQPNIIAAWIKSTSSLCEDKNSQCDGLSVRTAFVAHPLGRPELQPVNLEVPARPSLPRKSEVPTVRPPLPFDVLSRPSIFE